MANELMKDTAKALVFISGMNFYGFAFEDESGLTDEEQRELINEIQKFCKQGLRRIEKKYNISIPHSSTEDVIDAIMFEDE